MLLLLLLLYSTVACLPACVCLKQMHLIKYLQHHLNVLYINYYYYSMHRVESNRVEWDDTDDVCVCVNCGLIFIFY